MITSYYYKGPESDPWEFNKLSLQKVNLLVGVSGSGKTKYLNTLYNFSEFIAKGHSARTGLWELTVEADGFEYNWKFEVKRDEQGANIISRDVVKRRLIDLEAPFEELVVRSEDSFVFIGNQLPKLQADMSSVFLLKEEDVLKPLYSTFAKVQRRNFHEEGVLNALSIQTVTTSMIDETKGQDGIIRLLMQENSLSAKLYLLKENFPDLYKSIVDIFRSVFDSITDSYIQVATNPPPDLGSKGIVPVFFVAETGINKRLSLQELSSGMQKVLLIITDIVTLPKGSIYIIDEYENSLGVNAINFLPEFLLSQAEEIQLFITTHHPYLINSMPMSTWRVFHRVGSKVSIKSGSELEKQYGKSKQKAFVQLTNDPFYTGS